MAHNVRAIITVRSLKLPQLKIGLRLRLFFQFVFDDADNVSDLFVI
ncbi:hypothetical protein Xenpb_00882 [Xenorhabdus sp. PB62.4]|nr:hypothetical protein [Xenorhabdus sp. PB62.4]